MAGWRRSRTRGARCGAGWNWRASRRLYSSPRRLELFARSGAMTPFMLPLSSVLDTIWDGAIAGDLFINLGLALYRALVSFDRDAAAAPSRRAMTRCAIAVR